MLYFFFYMQVQQVQLIYTGFMRLNAGVSPNWIILLTQCYINIGYIYI